MPSNDEVVFGIPQIQCPSCQWVLDLSRNKFEKFTKQQRKEMHGNVNYCTSSTSGQPRDPFPNGEDSPSQRAEKVYVVVSCENHHCEQYNKIKILKLPRIYTPSVKLDLGGLE